MDFLTVLKLIAALLTTATGLLGLFRPAAVYGFIGLSAGGPRGVSEIRAIFGGLFIGLGIGAFILGAPAYRMLGLAYLSIAAARAFSMVYDRSYEKSNLISLVTEMILGIILIL